MKGMLQPQYDLETGLKLNLSNPAETLNTVVLQFVFACERMKLC